MSCEPTILKQVPIFALFDDDELALLASQVELRTFAPRQRIYKSGDAAGKAYVLLSGAVRVTTIDEDQQDVVFDEPARGDFFGFASLLDETPHQTTAVALEESVCIQVERRDLVTLVHRKPHAAIDMMTVLGRRLHSAQTLIRGRAARNPNVLIESEATLGERLADAVAGFGGSWTFLTATLVLLAIYCALNLRLGAHAWDPYPFILLNLILSMLAAVQAPVIMMSQNRQNKDDRVRGELDFEVNRRAAADIQGLAGKLNVLVDKVGDIDEELRAFQRGGLHPRRRRDGLELSGVDSPD
jgi:CRP/FNR family transcriptional regulator, cyclic AMP receptor protein